MGDDFSPREGSLTSLRAMRMQRFGSPAYGSNGNMNMTTAAAGVGKSSAGEGFSGGPSDVTGKRIVSLVDHRRDLPAESPDAVDRERVDMRGRGKDGESAGSAGYVPGVRRRGGGGTELSFLSSLSHRNGSISLFFLTNNQHKWVFLHFCFSNFLPDCFISVVN